MLSNLTSHEISVLEGVPTLDLVDEIITRCIHSDSNEFFTRDQIDKLKEILNDPNTGTL